MDVTCAAYTSLGGLYRFQVQVTDESQGTAPDVVDADISIDVLGDGSAVTPGFAVLAGTDLTNPITGIYEFRAESIDGPFTATQLDWPFLILATAPSTVRRLASYADSGNYHRALQTGQILGLGSPAAIENCKVAGPTTSGSTTVWYIFCEAYAPGDYVFTSTDDAVTASIDISYDGAVVLSSSDESAATQTFSFTAPETRGEPLPPVQVEATTAQPSQSIMPSVSISPSVSLI